MSVSGTINILLFFLHLLGVLISVGVVFYFVSVWASGRQREAALFPYTEVELGIRILGASLGATWLATLPMLVFTAPVPANYFSGAGVALLTILTIVSLLATWLILQIQDQVTAQSKNARFHIHFRIVTAATVASLIVLVLLILPASTYNESISTLYAGDVVPEILGVFALLLLVILSVLTIVRDSWLDRPPVNPQEDQ